MRIPQLFLPLILALTTVVSADTVTLVGGEKIEGKVISETATELTIEVASGGVVEERVVKKSDVQGTSKLPPDEVAWQALKGLKLGNDSLPSVQQYDAYITPLRAFTTQFADSKYKGDAAKILADFEAEKKRIADGELKFAGKWMSKEEVQRERYQINATIAANFMREQSKRDPIGALNTFDTIEKQYPGSRAWIDAVEMASRLSAAAKQQADARQPILQTEITERERAVKAAAPTSRKQMEAEMERKEKLERDQLDAASRQNLKWPPYIPSSVDSLRRISNLAESESRRLQVFDLAKARQSVKLAEEARAAFAKKDLDGASELLRKAREAWGDNEMIRQLEPNIAEARTAAASEPKPEEKPANQTAANATAKPDGSESTSENTSTAPDVEAQPTITPARIVIGIVLLALVVAGWKAYNSVRSKANEIIE